MVQNISRTRTVLKNLALALFPILSIGFVVPFANTLILAKPLAAIPPDSVEIVGTQAAQETDSANIPDNEKQTSDKEKSESLNKTEEKVASTGKDGQTSDPADPTAVAKERKAREAAKKRGEITFDDLKFEIEKGAPFKPEMLTEDNKDLNKKTWKIRGFILPTTLFSKSNIREFVLVRDNQECCFGPGAALYDCIMVTMAPGKSINFSTRVVAVQGVLEIDTESFLYPDTEEHYAIYKMTAEEVK